MNDQPHFTDADIAEELALSVLGRRDMISPERLRKLLAYDPETGIFTWLVVTTNSVKIGDVAGCDNRKCYWQIGVDGKNYKAHRLAWLWVTGEWPAADIDHVDLNRRNNRIANLREATRSENLGNTRKQANNTSGFKGVSWHRQCGKWRAEIGVGGRRHSLGYFVTPEAAHAAYIAAAERAFGEFARAS